MTYPPDWLAALRTPPRHRQLVSNDARIDLDGLWQYPEVRWSVWAAEQVAAAAQQPRAGGDHDDYLRELLKRHCL